MSPWTILLVLVVIGGVIGAVIYFDYQRNQKPTPGERLGSGVGDIVTSVAQIASGQSI